MWQILPYYVNHFGIKGIFTDQSGVTLPIVAVAKTQLP